LNGSSAASGDSNGSRGSRSSRKSATPSEADFDSDADSHAGPLSAAMSDSSLVDPTAIEATAIEGVRQLKKAAGLESVELVRGTSGSVSADGGDEWKWGRAMNNDWISAVLAFGMMSVVPWIVLLMLHSCRYHQCSIQASVQQAMKEGQSKAAPAQQQPPPHPALPLHAPG